MVDAIRGIAAIFVLVSHADAYYLIRFDDHLAIFKNYFSHVGVYLFFVLSGFLIWKSAINSMSRNGGAYRFVVHRVARVAPLYYFALAFAIVVFPMLSGFPQELTAETILRHLVFSQKLNPDVSRAINPVLWTLTHEVIFYAVVPLLFMLRRVFPIIVGLSALATLYGWTQPEVMFSPFFRLYFLFVLGMILAEYDITPSPTFAVAAILLSCIATYDVYDDTLATTLWAVSLFSVAAVLRGWQSNRLIVLIAFVGKISFSVYIWHYMLIEIVGPHLLESKFSVHYQATTAAGFAAFCVFVSWISYSLIELPGQRALRRLLLHRFDALHPPAKSSTAPTA